MHVAALYRHPIKSHGREAIDRITLTKGQTMPWDRTWAVTHEATKYDPDNPGWAHCRNFMLGSRTPGLAGIWAKLNETTRTVTLTHIDLPDITIQPDEPTDVARFLAWVAPLCPDDRAGPMDIISAGQQGMTDSQVGALSIANLASHGAVQDALGSPITLERWRANIWIDGAEPWVEHNWLGQDLRIGKAVFGIRERARRCSLTNTNPVTGLRDLTVLDTLNGTFGHQDFGVYAEVIETGEVALNDTAELI
ncbi:MAG: MOSC N-terminal beta barrel domain-containing protein [Sulfitobacter sp.]